MLLCWNNHRPPRKRRLLDGGTSLQNSNISRCINCTLKHLQVINAMNTIAPPYPRKLWPLHMCNGLSALSLLRHVDPDISFFFQKQLKLRLMWPENRCLTVFLRRVDIWPLLCVIRSTLFHIWMQQGTVLREKGFSKDSWAHVAWWFSHAVLPENSKVTCIQRWFPSLPFTYRHFSRLPESCHKMMQCRCGDTKVLNNFTLKIHFWTDGWFLELAPSGQP